MDMLYKVIYELIIIKCINYTKLQVIMDITFV